MQRRCSQVGPRDPCRIDVPLLLRQRARERQEAPRRARWAKVRRRRRRRGMRLGKREEKPGSSSHGWKRPGDVRSNRDKAVALSFTTSEPTWARQSASRRAAALVALANQRPKCLSPQLRANSIYSQLLCHPNDAVFPQIMLRLAHDPHVLFGPTQIKVIWMSSVSVYLGVGIADSPKNGRTFMSLNIFSF